MDRNADFRGPFLEFDRIASRPDRPVDHFFGQFDGAVMVYPDLGYDKYRSSLPDPLIADFDPVQPVCYHGHVPFKKWFSPPIAYTFTL
jgi:hypothetical protein